jgi:CheY-like chemotaxis protein
VTPHQTILVVDDQAPIYHMLLDLLADEGYTAIGAHNGRMALDLVHEQIPDLILLDVMMPEMDGPMTLQMLRSVPKLTRIPVVLLTVAPERFARGLGAMTVLPKPVDLEHLLAVIASTLTGGT